MISIVIVSHSRKLSDGLKDIADAMSQAPVPIVSAGGMDDPENPLGTDALRILDAIHGVMSDEGVLVFADIGSARLNAEMAIDLLEPDKHPKAHFCDAPLVEGVLAAAVQIAAGSRLEVVMREARQAGQAITPTEQPIDNLTDGISHEFTIQSRLGLHARPAALFVKAMNVFKGDIRLVNVTKNKHPVNAKSINGVMLSEVSANDTIRVVTGPEEAEAVFAEIDRLIRDNFGEESIVPTKPAQVEHDIQRPSEPPDKLASGTLKGISIAPGFAVGPLHHLRRNLPEIEPIPIADTKAEIDRFETALTKAEAEIGSSLQGASKQISAYDRKIFDAHIAYLHDPEILDHVRNAITADHLCAEGIWRRTIAELAQTYRTLGDPLLRARAGDIIDVGLRVLRFLGTDKASVGSFDNPVILAFDELRPSDVLTLNETNILGICAMSGGKTSHAGILASALSIPVIFALGDALEGVPEGRQLLLDGADAKITISPDHKAIEKMEADRSAWEIRRAQAEAVRLLAAETTDGHKVRVAANMASVDELGLIADSGAEEIGLLRTEFLFMRRDAPPTEKEQYDLYRTIVEGLEGRPLTVRTVDIGGDKPVPYMNRPSEANPNLGWRGLRYSLDMPQLFETQLAAILRASAGGPVRIMFPLVSTVDEVRAAKKHVNAVMDLLRQRGVPFDTHIEIGIMIEVPAAAEMAELLAREVDFFSIGTNDLTQYVMAADRANPKVQTLFDPFHPAVLRMVAKSIRAAHDAGIWIGMCGAMAGNPMAVPILLGLGLDEFSMTPLDIAEFKLTLRGLAQSECHDLAIETLQLSSAEAVREQVSAYLGR